MSTQTMQNRVFGAVMSAILALASGAEAHVAWVETDGTAAPGREQSAKIYFGEYGEFLREESGGRLDTLDGVTLKVVDAKRGITDLPLAKNGNHFEGRLASCRPGRYAVLAEQTAAEVQDLTKYDHGIVKPMFHARSQFVCFEEGRLGEREAEALPQFDLDVIPVSKGVNLAKGITTYWPGGEIVAKVVYKGAPLASRQVIVHAPNGWDKELHTDAQGIATFTPPWAGRYVLEVEHQDKTPGEFKGKPYEAVRHRSTLSLHVVGGPAMDPPHGR